MLKNSVRKHAEGVIAAPPLFAETQTFHIGLFKFSNIPSRNVSARSNVNYLVKCPIPVSSRIDKRFHLGLLEKPNAAEAKDPNGNVKKQLRLHTLTKWGEHQRHRVRHCNAVSINSP